MTKSRKLQRKARKEAAKALKRKAQRARQNQRRRTRFQPKGHTHTAHGLYIQSFNPFTCELTIMFIPEHLPNQWKNVTDEVTFKFRADRRTQITENGATFLSHLSLKELAHYY